MADDGEVEADHRRLDRPPQVDGHRRLVGAGLARHQVINGDIAAWLSTIDRSPSIVHRAYGVLNGILKQAVKDGRLGRNPATGVDSLPRRRTRRIRRYLTQDELRRVADASGSHRPLVLTLGYCGLRWGEAVALKVTDVDLEKRRITVHRSPRYALRHRSELVDRKRTRSSTPGSRHPRVPPGRGDVRLPHATDR